MVMNSTYLLYYSTMIIGVIMCACSNNWIMIWIGLEISLMSFMPVMVSSNLLSSECMMKYFIIQSMSSSILMLGLIFMIMNNNFWNFMLIVSLILKIGMSPFHNWVLGVIEGLTFNSIFILLSIMKISPLIVFSYVNQVVTIPIILSLVVGATMGLNQNSFRKILGYSSIFNIAFICSCISEISYWIMYMIIYMIMLWCVIYFINDLNIFYLNQIMINEYDLKIKISFWILMASFGGIPPMLGFLSKLIVLEYVVFTNQLVLLFFMIVFSLIVIFYYTRCSYLCIMMSSVMFKWNLISLSTPSLLVIFINLVSVTFLIMFKFLT
uniref:NADH dehydrogenase subunit 2 n=1 Tax=Anatkina vespertinula TaxID=2498648 RepID=UPI0022FD42A4|nr:NADH dehydrogenase subunit 2 [Anatkina vespertinula]WAP91749.1 NADH dehydrogenase subunit 2 [Anatkina vespertinula]